jgi:hypothetical protein
LVDQLIYEGKQSQFYQSLQTPIDIESFRSSFDFPNYLEEYLTLREQWELRIPHQNSGKSRHNSAVETLSKDLLRTYASDPTIVLMYNVLRTMITFAPDFGFAQGLVDVALMIADVCLNGEIERTDDEAQAIVFWALNKLLFELGQSRWYMSSDSWVREMIILLSKALASVYPALELFARYQDFQVFHHMIAGPVTVFTRMFEKPLLRKLWRVAFLKGTVDVLHISTLIVILLRGFPELSKAKVLDFVQVTKLLDPEYPVGDEAAFLALIAVVAAKIDAKKVQPPEVDLQFSIFSPRK